MPYHRQLPLAPGITHYPHRTPAIRLYLVLCDRQEWCQLCWIRSEQRNLRSTLTALCKEEGISMNDGGTIGTVGGVILG